MAKLTCGCCGIYFSGDQTAGHDHGFGTCPKCESEEVIRFQAFLEQAANKLATVLTPANKAKFEKLSKPRQEKLIIKLIDKGVLKWTF